MNPFKTNLDEQDSDYRKRHGHHRRYRARAQFTSMGPSFCETGSHSGGKYQVLSRRSADENYYGFWQRTVDYNNRRRFENAKRRLKDGGYRFRFLTDGGGPFSSESIVVSPPRKISYTGLQGYFQTEESGEGNWYVGDTSGWLNGLYNQNFTSSLAPISDFTLLREGTRGIADTIPTAPEMSIAQTIGELKKDGLPSIIGSQLNKRRSLSSVGGEYLNYQFGIAPLANDVSDVIRLTKDYEKIIRQFRRDQGRVVRRRRTLLDETDSEDRALTGTDRMSYAMRRKADGTFVGVRMADIRNPRQKTTVSNKIWFSGAYSISYTSSLDGPLKELQEFNRVFGVIPTPELAWELLPWSWLVDWFSNVGDIVRNISYLSTPMTNIAYAYVMGQSTRTQIRTGTASPNYYWVANSHPTVGQMENRLTQTYKRRLRASPFGFGFLFGDLSNRQKSILGALGLSRLKL